MQSTPPNEKQKMITKDSTYWRSVEEKDLHGKLVEPDAEFASSPIRDAASDSDKDGLDTDENRRDFLKLMAAAGVMMGASACTRRPVEKILPYLKQTDEIVPGISNWYASSCNECDAGCGTLVRTREGRPVKVEGNSNHPISKGGLCARGQASVYNLYDADRMQSSFESNRKGVTNKLSLEAVDQKVSEKLKAIKAKNGKVVVLTGEITSPSTRKLIDEFVKGCGAGSSHLSYEPLNFSNIATAGYASYGSGMLPRYSVEKASFILSFGADFLGTWNNPVEFAKGFSKNRKVGTAGKGAKEINKLVVIESMMTLTGTNADERYRVRSGAEASLAMALAHELIVVQGKSKFASDSAVTTALKKFASVELGDLSKESLKKLATELWEAKGKSIVFGGGYQTSGDNGVALEVAVNLLNSALENEGATIHADQGSAIYSSTEGFKNLIAEMNAGKVDALIIYKTNPVYFGSKKAGFENALARVGFVVDMNTSFDETAQSSDLAVAVTHSFETWGDNSPQTGIFGIQQPTISPMYAATRSFEDSLIVWSRKLSFGGILATTANWFEFLKTNWQTIQKEVGNSSPFMLFWEGLLRAGFVEKASRQTASSSARSFKSAALVIVEKLKAASSGLSLILYPKVGMFDGRNANNSWLHELPDPVTKATWGNYVQVSVDFAKKNNIADGDMVRVNANNVSVDLPAQVQPGHADETISIAVGFGRKGSGQIGDNIGANVFPMSDWDQMNAIPVTLAKTGGTDTLATTQRHHSMEGRNIVRETTITEYKKDPTSGNEEHEKLVSLWPKHDYPGYRWAMAIDLSACTGCSACVIGCSVENNIPVVGKKHVVRSREMHWLRIDRYYSGRADNPETVHQPMMCQQCENAPCESVCPVLATMHDHEGLNQQIYNRCVGTRYCANNCPYKVRRFNWFTFTEVAKPMQLAYNPDVLVRTRGVMEKCTFCVQRVREGKDHAKDLKRSVNDGDIKTACMQSCPTDAISFGNINDKNSTVHKLAKDERAYYVLEDLNVGPSVSYLTKIRNKGEA